MQNNIYPWQSTQFQLLLQRYKLQQFPHALLLSGVEGLGKKEFAFALSNALLCSSHNNCGQCRACHLFNAGSHPDFIVVQPEEAGQRIKVDQIRELVNFANETAFQQGEKIIIISPATAMNVNAANALLKTLEEPPPKTFFILISHQNARLPATILSRCQKIFFQKPSENDAIKWLQTKLQKTDDELRLLLNLGGGSPMQALAFADEELFNLRKELYEGLCQRNPLKLAAKMQEHNLIFLLNLTMHWLRDLLRIKLTSGKCEVINFDYQNALMQCEKKFSREKLLKCIEHVQKIYGFLLGSLNLNRQLVLEDIFSLLLASENGGHAALLSYPTNL